MIKVEKQKSMNINGGHFATAWPSTDLEASQNGVAGWEQKCPKYNHTYVHIFVQTAYSDRYGTGRTYACPKSYCNK